MEENVNEEQIKIDHLNKWREKNVDPYPSEIKKDSTVEQARGMEGKTTSTAGRVVSLRSHGKSTFADITDESGKIQVYFKSDNLGEKYADLELIDTGDFISVEGEVFITKMGEVTILVHDFSLISKSIEPLPASWYGVKDIELRFRRRFLDLVVNEKAKETLNIRAKTISFLRRFMEDEGFVELETPILQPIPGVRRPDLLLRITTFSNMIFTFVLHQNFI